MLKESEIKKIEAKIGYQFKNKTLLKQAFSRRSYSAVSGGENNEVMEFLGDRALAFAVVKDFADLYGRINSKTEFVCSKSVGELSRENVELVKNANLADCITRLGLTKYMQVRENREKTNAKSRADLFEAILGAVALDSDWNVGALSQTFRRMMYGHEELRDEKSFDFTESFITEVLRHHLFVSKSDFCQTEFNVRCSFAMSLCGRSCKIEGAGKSEQEAERDAFAVSYKLCRFLLEKEFPADEDYTTLLYLLYKKGFVAEPNFRFEYFPVNSMRQRDLWKCHASLSDSDEEFEVEASSLHKAKNTASYAILCATFGIAPEEVDFEPEIVRGQGLLKHILSKYGSAA